MKSRWTTYLLLGITAVVWGVVAWRLFASASAPSPSVPQATARPPVCLVADTLQCDYPDPFLKERPAVAHPVVQGFAPVPKPVRREKVRIVHLATAASGAQTFYILSIENEQYEARCGETAGEFRITGCDADSLYLQKEGVSYGVKLCE